tara:strand:- start:2580 stop:3026 length:447 start_codon:yes stop_codon:yes gene_type:complete
MKYLKQFVVGSSWLVFFPFFYRVYNAIEFVKKNDTNHYYNILPQKPVPFYWPKKYRYYSYFRYTLTAPLWFGFWNVISLIIAEHFGLTIRKRLLLISILSISVITMNQIIYNTYNFKTNKDYLQYIIKITILYMFVWNIIIYNIEVNI